MERSLGRDYLQYELSNLSGCTLCLVLGIYSVPPVCTLEVSTSDMTFSQYTSVYR